MVRVTVPETTEQTPVDDDIAIIAMPRSLLARVARAAGRRRLPAAVLLAQAVSDYLDKLEKED